METRLEPDAWPTAIATTDGPQLVVAGPGAGKTEFLVRRAAYLLEGGLMPTRLRVLSFSRRGAGDLTTRLRARLCGGVGSVPASTFHSLAARILETHGARSFGWSEPPALLTGPEQVSLVAELLEREAPEGWPVGFRGLLGSRSFAGEVADFVLRATEHGLEPADLTEAAANRSDWSGLDGFLVRYRQALADRHRLDYASLIAAATRAAGHPEVHEAIAAEIAYVLVDEYQDTTPSQAALLEALGGHLTAAADPYQSVYSFRGASLENVAAFPDRFRDNAGRPARRWVLTRSFRVPRGVLESAERLVGGSLPGAAGPVEPAGDGGRVDCHVFDQQTHEADWIAGEVERAHLVEGIPLREIAVLVRSTRRFLPDLSRSLDRRGIPHDRPDGRLVDHAAIRTLSDLALLASPDGAAGAEQLRAARRLLLGPLVGLGVGEERDVLRQHLRSPGSWSEVFASIPRPVDGIPDLLAGPDWVAALPAHAGFWHLWTTVPALARLAVANEEWREALTAFGQVLARLGERDPSASLARFFADAGRDDFEATPLLRHAEAPDQLVVTTLHQAKGLEFEVVVIADAVDGVLPDLRRTASILNTHLLPDSRRDPTEAARFRIQEELRLAYTAMTRARRRVIWTATAAGLDESEDRPSRFLDAITGSPTPPPRRSGPPVTAVEAEATLRRTLTDPTAAPVDRLAALAVLSDPPTDDLRPPTTWPGVAPRGPDGQLVPDDAAFSPSQAAAYETCPRKYALERRLDIGEDGSVYLSFGTLVHAVAEVVDRAALESGRERATSAEALAELGRTFDPADFGGRPWSDHWYRRAELALTNLYDHAPAGGRPILVEYPLELRIDGEQWRGRADRIDATGSGVRIVDYKTSKTMVQVGEAKTSLQLGFYALAAAADATVAARGSVEAAELWYPLGRSESVGVRSFDVAGVDDVRQRLVEIARSIRSEDFPAVISGACGRCPVRTLCDAWPDGTEAFVP